MTRDFKNDDDSTSTKKDKQPAPAHPVDTGFAWVVLSASCMMVFLIIGLLKSYGIFFIEFLKEFEGSVSSTSLLTTVQTLSYCIIGTPVLTCGVKKVSVRKFIMLGVISTSLSYGLSSLATSLQFLYFSQSFLIGSGMAFLFGPNLFNIGKYFDKRRGLANGILFACHSLGGFTMPYLLRYLLDNYGFRGALLLTSGVSFQTLVFASLLRPTEHYLPKQKPKRHLDIKGDTEQAEELLTFDDGKNLYNSQPNLTISNSKDHLREMMRKRSFSFSPENATRQNSSSKTSNGHGTSISNISRYLSNGELVSLSLNDMEIIGSERLKNYEQNAAGRKTLFSCCSEVFNFKLLRNPSLLIYLPVYLCGSISPSFSSIFIPTYAKEQGLSDQEVATMISVLSLADFGGRIIVGYVSDKSWIRKQKIVIISQTILGTILILNKFFVSYWTFLVCVGAFGLFGGTLFTLFSSLVIEMVGIQNFPNAMVILLIVQSVFLAGIAPLLGYLRDVTGTYNATLYLIASLSYSSASIFSLQELYIAVKNRNSNNATKDSEPHNPEENKA